MYNVYNIPIYLHSLVLLRTTYLHILLFVLFHTYMYIVHMFIFTIFFSADSSFPDIRESNKVEILKNKNSKL